MFLLIFIFLIIPFTSVRSVMTSRESKRTYFLKDATKQQKCFYNYALAVSCFAFSIIYLQNGLSRTGSTATLSQYSTLVVVVFPFRDVNTIKTLYDSSGHYQYLYAQLYPSRACKDRKQKHSLSPGTHL